MLTEKDKLLTANTKAHATKGKGIKWMDFQNWYQLPGNELKTFEDYLRHLKAEPKSEAALERQFCRKVEKEGGWAVKFNPLGNTGLPDRIVFYKGCSWLVELKTPKGIVKPHQKAVHKKFSNQGFEVYVIRTSTDVTRFIQKMKQLNP